MNPSLVSPQTVVPLKDRVVFDSRDSFPLEPGRAKTLVVIVAVLAAVALCVASYLTWATWTQTPIAGCDTSGLVSCDHVLASPWSKWFGMPVSFFGALTYVAILAACAMAIKLNNGFAWTLLITLSLMAAGSALWFIGLQALVIGHFCTYCMGVHACGITIGALMIPLVRELVQGKPVESHMSAFFGASSAPLAHESVTTLAGFRPLLAATLAAGGLAILMAGQFIFQPAGLVLEQVDAPAPKVEEPAEIAAVATDAKDAIEAAIDDEPVDQAADEPTSEKVASAPGESAKADEAVEPAVSVQEEAAPVALVPGYAPPSRIIAFKGLSEAIDVYKVPVLGNRKAKHIIVEMIDYTCSHCRQFHPNIHPVLERYGDQVAFVVQHVPLSKKCNPHVQRDSALHKYACDYARLSLGVFKLAPQKWPEYHDWLMKDEKKAPSVFEARQKAMQLAGEKILLDQSMKADSFRSFAGNSDEVKQLNAGLPVLLTEYGVIRGVPKTEKELFQFLEELLDIKPLSEAAN